MATIPNKFSPGETISGAELDANFDALADALDGGLTNDNVSPDARISLDKLENSRFELVYNWTVTKEEVETVTSTTPRVLGHLPGDGENWEVTGIDLIYFNGGSGSPTAATCQLQYGDTTLHTGNITIGAVSSGAAMQVSALTVSNAATSLTSDPLKYFHLDVSVAGTNMDATEIYISVKLKRKLK